MKLEHIIETCLYVDDLDAARDFYGRVLGLELYSEVQDRHVFFRLKNGMFLLFNPDVTRTTAQDMPAHGVDGAGHVAFRIASEDIPRWRQHLVDHGITIEAERVWPNGEPSLYFRDPSGNVLEVTTGALWGY